MSAAPLLEAKDLTRHYAVGDSLVRCHASLGGAETGA